MKARGKLLHKTEVFSPYLYKSRAMEAMGKLLHKTEVFSTYLYESGAREARGNFYIKQKCFLNISINQGLWRLGETFTYTAVNFFPSP